MFGKFMPREGKFFEFFNQHAELAVRGTVELAALMGNLEELNRRRPAIEELEKEADKVTHDCIEMLHQIFITPLDRDQIHKLVTTMDDILDLSEDVAQCVDLYDVHRVSPEAKVLADICVRCAERTRDAVAMLNDMSRGQEILNICKEIDRLETDADQVMRSAIAKLFREEPDAKEILKQKAIYELLETITDRSEDVANILESIVLENA
jgi:uncharacterized protein